MAGQQTVRSFASEDCERVLGFIRSQFAEIKEGNMYCEIWGDGAIVLASVRLGQGRTSDEDRLLRR